ncbi:MAG: efflux RND transporter periplasmic adaptor subunit, partial [Phycisphaerales bacterium]
MMAGSDTIRQAARKFAMAVVAVILVVLGFWLRGFFVSSSEPVVDAHAGHAHAGAEAEPQVWTCSMHPQIRLPEPGLCPICNMDLIPVSDDETARAAGPRELTVSAAAAKLMDVETVPVERKTVRTKVRMVGKVEYDETRLAYITAWIPGRLDRLFVDYTGVPVRAGDHMVSLYSPQLLSAQEELLQAVKAAAKINTSSSSLLRETTEGTVQAAREKLRLWGLTAQQVAEIEQSGTVGNHMTIYAPTGGIVIHKNAVEGMYVNEGTRIYTIADLSQVWVKLDAYESDLEWLRYGQEVEFTTVAYPGRTFTGTIAFIDPVLNERTRTTKIRVNVPNPEGKLKPEMFVKAVVHADIAAGGHVMDAALAGKWMCPMHPEIVKSESGLCDICEMPLVTTESLGYTSDGLAVAEKPLVIPVSAALVTGTRAVVYVQKMEGDAPTFEGREIVLGPRAGDYYLVRRGLEEGELVVVKGNFKIDSALQILAKPSMMTPQEDGSQEHEHMGHEQPVLGPALREQLSAVYSGYFRMHAALAGDEAHQAMTAATETLKAVEAVAMTLFDNASHEIWMKTSAQLRKALSEAAQTDDIKTLREDFYLVS